MLMRRSQPTDGVVLVVRRRSSVSSTWSAGKRAELQHLDLVAVLADATLAEQHRSRAAEPHGERGDRHDRRGDDEQHEREHDVDGALEAPHPCAQRGLAHAVDRDAPEVVDVGAARRDADFEEARHDVHFDVAEHRGAQHADELGFARRAERDEHALDPVLDDDAVEIVDVAEQRARQTGIRRADEARELEAVLGMHDDEIRELDADVAGAGDERRLAQAAATRAAQQRVTESRASRRRTRRRWRPATAVVSACGFATGARRRSGTASTVASRGASSSALKLMRSRYAPDASNAIIAMSA